MHKTTILLRAMEIAKVMDELAAEVAFLYDELERLEGGPGGPPPGTINKRGRQAPIPVQKEDEVDDLPF